MKTPPTTKILMAVLATGILALGAIAVGVEAKPGDDGGASGAKPCDHPASPQAAQRCQMAQDRRNVTQDRKDLRQDRRQLRDDVKEACDKAAANSTLAKRCEHLKDAVKARRVAHALLTAIRVHELELGRVEVRISEVQAKLAAGNLTGNETHALEVRLEKLNQRHDKLIEKIESEKAKLQTLHDKWSEVADHLRDRKEKGEDDGDVSDTDAPTSDSPETLDDSSTSAAA